MRYWLLLLFALTLAAQPPSFEVASIRPGTTRNTGSLCRDHKLSPESAVVSAVLPLSAVLEEAYASEVDDFDYPPWSRSGNYAIWVKLPPNTTADTCRKMLQNFLAERFHMVTGVEIRDVRRYHLKVAKSGVKLKPVGSPPKDPNAEYGMTANNGVARHTFRGAPMSRIVTVISAGAFLEARNHSLRETGSVDDPGLRIASVNSVVDDTGLTGYYDGEYDFRGPGATQQDELAESLADALRRQLGLTLELEKSPGKVLVIRSPDHMPTEN